MLRYTPLVCILLAACATEKKSVPAPVVIVKPKKSAPAQPVQLARSFSIRSKSGKSVTHVPLVRLLQQGRQFAAATDLGELIVWDARTQQEVDRFQFSKGPARATALDLRGRYLVVCHESGDLQVIETTSRKVKGTLSGVRAGHLAVGPQARLVALAVGDQLHLRALPSLELVERHRPGKGRINGLAWGPTGKQLALVTEKGQVEVLSMPKMKRIYSAAKSGPLYAVAFRPGTDQIAYGGKEKRIYQADLSTGKEQVISGRQPYWITTLGYSPDGRRIVAGDESCDIWLYQLDQPKLLFHSKHHVECWLSGVAWYPDSKRFLFGCRPNTHAGRPTVYPANLVQEARLSKPVRALEDQILRLREQFNQHLALTDKKLAAKLQSLARAAEEFEVEVEEFEVEVAQSAPVASGPEPEAAFTTTELIALIQAKVDAPSWTAAKATIESRNGMLVVRASPGVQAAVGKLLSHLRGQLPGQGTVQPISLPTEAAVPVSKVYNVRDLTLLIQDFKGVDIQLAAYPSEAAWASVAPRGRLLKAWKAKALKDPALAAIERQVRELSKKRAALLEKEVTRLRGSFRVNQWEVK